MGVNLPSRHSGIGRVEHDRSASCLGPAAAGVLVVRMVHGSWHRLYTEPSWNTGFQTYVSLVRCLPHGASTTCSKAENGGRRQA